MSESLIAALKRSENDWSFVYNLADGVELTYEVRRALAEANLALIRAALASVREAPPGDGPVMDR